MDKPLQIAIDGPVAAGKSSLAKAVALELGLLYVDTGAMYRCVALLAQEQKIDWRDEVAISSLVSQPIDIRMAKPVGKRNDGRTVSVYLNNTDVSWQIRTPAMGEGASIVSQYKSVRTALVRWQRQLVKGKEVIMEGRDIGTVVLPQAKLKVFLTADLQVRANRQWQALQARGDTITLQEVTDAIAKRDHREMTRAIDPLKPAVDAWILDTTELSLAETVTAITNQVKQLETTKA